MSIQIDYDAGTLTVTRVFDAPRELVFDAWTRSEIVNQWWGCAQTKSVEHEIDLRVGGQVRVVMHGEYGVMRHIGRITELEPPARFAYVLEPDPEAPDAPFMDSSITVTFVDVGGKTEVTLEHAGLPDDPFIREMVSGGWTAAFTKLGDGLDKKP